MSGHNKWSQIKNKKGVADQKRGQLFSKLLKAISIAAKTDPNPQFNPRLRAAIETAKENNVPQDNIERAVSKASEEKNLEDVIVEAYGPEGVALIIEAITDNKNRTMAEIKHLLTENGAKIANQGSVLWAFSADLPAEASAQAGGGSASGGNHNWQPKFPQTVSEETKTKLKNLVEKINEHEDVQKITINISD